MLAALRSRFLPKLVPVRGFSSDLHPPKSEIVVPPRIERVDGFLRDTRRGQRELVQLLLPRKPVCGPIRLEVADVEDYALIAQFWTEMFTENCCVFRAMHSTYDEMAPYLFDLSKRFVPLRSCYIAWDGDKLIGAIYGEYYGQNEFEERFLGKFGMDNPEFVARPDYGEMIDNGPYASRNANRLYCHMFDAEAQTGKFIDRRVTKIGDATGVSLHKDYFLTGLGLQLNQILMDTMHTRHGCDCVVIHCVAPSTAHISTKYVGGTQLCEFKYTDFLDYGHPVFLDNPDKATGNKIIAKYYPSK